MLVVVVVLQIATKKKQGVAVQHVEHHGHLERRVGEP